jgi:hypothetical protein
MLACGAEGMSYSEVCGERPEEKLVIDSELLTIEGKDNVDGGLYFYGLIVEPVGAIAPGPDCVECCLA